jgi:hypothetical protein
MHVSATTASLIVAMLSLARPGFAEPTFAQVPVDVAVAKSLLDEAERLVSEGRVSEALARFEQSSRRNATPRGLLGLGDCYERLHRTASAWGAFHRAEERARGLGDAFRANEAAKRAQALEPRLSRIKVVVNGSALEVKLDGANLDDSVFGIAITMDPGRHQIEAFSPAKVRFSMVVELLVDGGTREVLIPELPQPAESAYLPGTWLAFSSAGPPLSSSQPVHETLGGIIMFVGIMGGIVGATMAANAKGGGDQTQRIAGVSMLGGGIVVGITGVAVVFGGKRR